MAETRTIKIFDGVKVITSKGIKICRSPRDLWKLFRWDIAHDEEASKCATEITRALLCYRRVDLTEQTTNGETLILEIIPADNFCVMYKEADAKKRWKHLDDIRRYEDDAKAEVERLNRETTELLIFKVGRWDE